MRFLITSLPKAAPIPPELAATLLNAMDQWMKRHTATKKIEQTWGFVTGGGGGILNVASHDELSAILTEMPFAPFSDIRAEPLIAMEVGLNNFRQAMARMSQPS
jgi:muconolactone delta-isomerase